MDQTYSNLVLEHSDGIGRIQIDSTSKRNALNPSLANELLRVVTDLHEDRDTRCIVLTGTDSVFCSGADLDMLEGSNADATSIRHLATLMHDVIIRLASVDKPVLTGVNGVAAGAGFSLALVGDIVIMSESAHFDFAYPRIGLTGDCGVTYFLPRLAGLRKAWEIALLDRSIGPDESVRIGLATKTVPHSSFEEEIQKVSTQLAYGPTQAYGLMRDLFNQSFERSLDEQLAHEKNAIAKAATSEDYQRGFAAFFSQDDPIFIGR